MIRLISATQFVAPSGQGVVFGIMDPADIDRLNLPAYQREELPVSSVPSWGEAFFNGEVPPLDLGSYSRTVTMRNDGGATVRGVVNLIDGLQRTRAARLVRARGGEVWLPVMVYLGTTYAWELARFRTLNAARRQVSANVLLRNSALGNEGLRVLYEYTIGEPYSVLGGRVQWEQRGRSGELLTAISLLRVAAGLHSHFGRGLTSNKAESLAWALGDLMEVVPPEVFRNNVNIFFEIIAASGNIKELEYSKGVHQLKLGYMLSMAQLLAGYSDFWDGHELVMTDAVRQALVKIKLDRVTIGSIEARPLEGLRLIMMKAVQGARRGVLTPW